MDTKVIEWSLKAVSRELVPHLGACVAQIEAPTSLAIHDLCLNMTNVASMSISYTEIFQEVGAHVLRSDQGTYSQIIARTSG